MKKYYLIIVLLIASKALFSQTIPSTGCEIVYFYDAAGNRTERTYYCNGAPTAFTTNNARFKKDSLQNASTNGVRVESLYPNPNDGKFTIIFNYELNNADVILRDLSGKTVQRFKSSGTQIGFDISKEAAGTYFLSIVADNTVLLTQKVIKAH